MSDPYPKWVAQVRVIISEEDGYPFKENNILDGTSVPISLTNIRNITRSTDSDKTIADDLFHPNAGAADQPHRHRIRLSIASVAEGCEVLEKLQMKNMFFRLEIRDKNESWRFNPVIYEKCKVVRMSEEMDFTNFPYVEYEIIALRKTVLDIQSDGVPETD